MREVSARPTATATTKDIEAIYTVQKCQKRNIAHWKNKALGEKLLLLQPTICRSSIKMKASRSFRVTVQPLILAHRCGRPFPSAGVLLPLPPKSLSSSAAGNGMEAPNENFRTVTVSCTAYCTATAASLVHPIFLYHGWRSRYCGQ